MAEQIQELINKIKQEGIEAVGKKAKTIEEEAHRKAKEITASAQKEAEGLLAKTKEDIKKMEDSSRLAITQASRNVILTLKKEIEGILNKIVKTQINDALTPDRLAELIETLVKKFAEGQSPEAQIQIALNPEDLGKLKNGFLSKLQGELKQPIKLRAAEDIGRGFTISFDGGKSSFDFSDASLAEYLSQYLNPQVSALIKEAV